MVVAFQYHHGRKEREEGMQEDKRPAATGLTAERI